MAARNTPSAGGKPDKLWRDALMIAVKRADEGGEDPRPYLARLADKCVQEALTGDMQAMKEIGDRLDGKPAQQVNLGNEDGGPLAVIIKRYTPEPIERA